MILSMPIQMGVSSLKAPYCIHKCFPNVGPLGLWMGQELFQGRAFDISL
jgi:hypothetical protein